MTADVIAAWESVIPRLLEDPAYRKLYTDNSLQPGFMPHAEYVAFMDTFGKDTEAFLQNAGVIE
jgi:tripartite-type tricarboxylate transporter receptor subunit TctC